MFADSLDEFDDSGDVVQSLRDEYIAAESPDYVEWGVGEEDDAGRAAGRRRRRVARPYAWRWAPLEPFWGNLASMAYPRRGIPPAAHPQGQNGFYSAL